MQLFPFTLVPAQASVTLLQKTVFSQRSSSAYRLKLQSAVQGVTADCDYSENDSSSVSHESIVGFVSDNTTHTHVRSISRFMCKFAATEPPT